MKNFKSIAMRCDKAQFESIKDDLIELGCEIDSLSTAWTTHCYLVNNLGAHKKIISNVTEHEKFNYNRTSYETFDPQIFLAACGKEQVERKIKGYKRNPNMDVKAEQLAKLLMCCPKEKDGLFFWDIFWNEGDALDLAQSYNIIGEDKLLVPVYEDISPPPTPSLDEFLKMDRNHQSKYEIKLKS